MLDVDRDRIRTPVHLPHCADRDVDTAVAVAGVFVAGRQFDRAADRDAVRPLGGERKHLPRAADRQIEHRERSLFHLEDRLPLGLGTDTVDPAREAIASRRETEEIMPTLDEAIEEARRRVRDRNLEIDFEGIGDAVARLHAGAQDLAVHDEPVARPVVAVQEQAAVRELQIELRRAFGSRARRDRVEPQREQLGGVLVADRDRTTVPLGGDTALPQYGAGREHGEARSNRAGSPRRRACDVGQTILRGMWLGCGCGGDAGVTRG